MRLRKVKSALVRTYVDVERNHTLQMAAALSYYFVMALFPALIFLSAIVAFLPVTGLFDQALQLMSPFVPTEGMVVIRKVLNDVVTPNRGAFLSLGLVGTLWTASGGFAAAIEALNIAYDVEETRPFWRTRPLAMILTLVIGLLLLTALATMIVGPHFGQWLADRMHLSRVWLWVWPAIHWLIAVSFTVLAVETLYFIAPNVKQRFLATLPGALLSVGCWIWTFLHARHLFPAFCELQPDLWNLGSRHRVDGVVVLDRFRHAGRRRTKRGACESAPRRARLNRKKTRQRLPNWSPEAADGSSAVLLILIWERLRVGGQFNQRLRDGCCRTFGLQCFPDVSGVS